MKNVLGIVKIFLISVLLSISAVVFFRQALCKYLIISSTAKNTGLSVSIEDLKLDVLGSSLCLRGVTFLNPRGFSNEVLVRVKEIFIEYDPLSLLKGRVHFQQVKAEISEINIIRNEDGGSNVSSFRKKEDPEQFSGNIFAAVSVEEKTERNKEKKTGFIIDRLELYLSRASFTDYKAKGAQSAVIIFTSEGPCVFKNVANLNFVVDSLFAKAAPSGVLQSLLK